MTNRSLEYVIFSKSTGRHSRIVSCRESQIQDQCRENECFKIAEWGVTTDKHCQDLETGETVELSLELEDPIVSERAIRDRLLSLSDWTQSPDNRLTAEQRAAWARTREEWRARIDDIKAGIPPRPWAEEPE